MNITIFLSLLIACWIGFELGKYYMKNKVQNILDWMAEEIRNEVDRINQLREKKEKMEE